MSEEQLLKAFSSIRDTEEGIIILFFIISIYSLLIPSSISVITDVQMNRLKKYSKDLKCMFFSQAFNWILNNIVIINPSIEIKTKIISVDEKSKTIPAEVLSCIFVHL